MCTYVCIYLLFTYCVYFIVYLVTTNGGRSLWHGCLHCCQVDNTAQRRWPRGWPSFTRGFWELGVSGSMAFSSSETLTLQVLTI